MADLMSDSETIAPDKFIFRIEVLVNQYEFFLKPNRTENIWLTPQHRRIKDLVEVGKAELQREMRGGDIGDRYWQPNPLPIVSSYLENSVSASFSIAASVKYLTLIVIWFASSSAFSTSATRTRSRGKPIDEKSANRFKALFAEGSLRSRTDDRNEWAYFQTCRQR